VRYLRSPFFWTLFLLSVFGFYWFSEELERVTQTPATAWTESHQGDCGIVLTGGPARVREGFDLLSQERVRKLIIAGVNPKSELREIFPELPFYGPLNPEDVILEKRSGTTYGNAQQALPLVEALGCKSVVLITSRLHMYRAHRIFMTVFPSEIVIFCLAIVAGSYQSTFVDQGLEAIKSMFYSIWAY